MCLFPKLVNVTLPNTSRKFQMKVPCGKCIECLQTRTHDWEYRLSIEKKNSHISVFTTLTYEDNFLPANGVQVRDLQLFIKRLRKHFKLTYYGIGEYGTRFKRPHYHVLIFVKDNSLKYSDVLSYINQSWRFGFTTTKLMHIGNIHYCVAYLIGSKTPFGLNKCFTCMSKKPPLGTQILQDKEFVLRLYSNDFAYLMRNGIKCHVPRIYRKKLNNRDYDIQDYINSLCRSCIDSYNSKKEYLKSHNVADLKQFLFINTLDYRKKGVDIDNYRFWLANKNENIDYTIKQRSKKLRND